MKKVTIAIISDLHCHPSDFKINGIAVDDTYLKTDMLRTSVFDHPVESLLRLVKDGSLTCDLTLCPGDFTSKSNRQGLIGGWDYCLEMGTSLNSSDIIGTIGNHDVDSYLTQSDYSFKNVRGIRKNFPFKDYSDGGLKDFWSIGCGFIEKENIRILVINSCHFHHNKNKSGSGEVENDLIEYVQDYLENKSDDKIFIVLTHHHPIDHSKIKLGEADKILNSDGLLEVLGKYKADLFVHGHKHHALMRYHPCTESGHKIPIFSSGSFSATSNLSWTQKRNHFHVVNIEKSGSDLAKGKIKTWTFFPKQGWVLNDDTSGFSVYAGFGFNGDLKKLIDLVVSKFKKGESKRWNELTSLVPEIEYLYPVEREQLEEGLRQRNIIFSKRIFGKTEHVFRLKDS